LFALIDVVEEVMPKIESLESRRLMADAHPIGINFNDEALWDVNFNTAVAEAKKLGVTSVRLWLGIDSYDSRPNAWDPQPAYKDAAAVYGTSWTCTDGYIMKRAFDLHRLGFSVMLCVTPSDGIVPTSTSQVTNLFTHLKNATETQGGSNKLVDSVDYWEVGNEPDLVYFWKESETDKVAGVKSFVDKFLIPAATVLKGAGEKVISGGVSWKPEDLGNLLGQVQLRGKMSLIDYAGYHPYGEYDPDTGYNPQKDRVLGAKAVADKYGKQLFGTEWNVRGYPPTGSDTTKWARAIDENFRNVMMPNFKSLYYFALVNNWPLRKGTTSARPAGVLKHNSTWTDLSGQSIATKEAYLRTALIHNEPFYSKVYAWQFGSISGVVSNSGSTASLTGRTVFVDVNGNAAFDTGEPSATTTSTGAYTLQYSTSQAVPGTYNVRVLIPSGWQSAAPAKSLALTALKKDTNVNFTLSPSSAPPVTTGSLAGVIWRDDDADAFQDVGEVAISGRVVFVDLNNDGGQDSGEPSATTNSSGAFTINYDTATSAAGSYKLQQVLPTGWEATLTPSVTLGAGRADTGVKSASRLTPPPPTTGSLAGKAFNDADADAIEDAGETALSGRTVYVDLDDSGTLDSGEPSAVTSGTGAFTINYDTADIAAGTYTLRQQLPTGWELTLSPTITLGANRTDTGVKSGSRVTPPPASAGTIAGRLCKVVNGVDVFDASETAIASRVIFVDLDGSGSLDTGEPSATTNGNGDYSIYYDTAIVAAGDYTLSQQLPTGWEQTTAATQVTLAAGGAASGVDLGSRLIPVAGTVSGTVWQDDDADGTLNGAEAVLADRGLFLDLNNNNTADTGEPTATTAADGTFTLNYSVEPGSAAKVRLDAVAGWETTTTPSSLTLAGGDTTDVLIGTRVKPIVTTGSVAGKVWNDTDADGIVDTNTNEQMVGGRVVFIDLDGNGALNGNEPSATSASDGTFKIDYDVAVITAGTYNLRQVLPTGWQQTTPIVQITVAGDSNETGYEIGTRQTTDPKTASITGFLWNDTDADGVVDSGESRTGARTVYIDANGNGQLDTGEKSVSSDSQGVYKFTGLAAGTYNITRVFPSGYRLSNGVNGSVPVTITAGQQKTGVNVGTTTGTVTPPPPTGTDPKTGVIGGFLWNDTDADGVVDSSESRTGSRTVYIDTNGNNKLDTGEKSVSADSQGNYKFTGLAAGTYFVTRVFPTGYRISNGTNGHLTITLAAAQQVLNANIGTRT
jgi:hypothetical protein